MNNTAWDAAGAVMGAAEKEKQRQIILKHLS